MSYNTDNGLTSETIKPSLGEAICFLYNTLSFRLYYRHNLNTGNSFYKFVLRVILVLFINRFSMNICIIKNMLNVVDFSLIPWIEAIHLCLFSSPKFTGKRAEYINSESAK